MRWEDQQKIKDEIAGKGDGSGSKKGQSDDASGEPKLHMLSDFAVEYAKSSRSKCKACDEKIEKVRQCLYYKGCYLIVLDLY